MLSPGVHDDFLFTLSFEEKNKQTNKQNKTTTTTTTKQLKPLRGYHFLRKGVPNILRSCDHEQTLKLSLSYSLATVYYFRSRFCVDVPQCSKRENE